MDVGIKKPRVKLVHCFIYWPYTIVFCKVNAFLDVPAINVYIFDVVVYLLLTFASFWLFTFVLHIQYCLIALSYLKFVTFRYHRYWTSLKIKSLRSFKTWTYSCISHPKSIKLLFLFRSTKILLRALPGIESFELQWLSITIIHICLLEAYIQVSLSIIKVYGCPIAELLWHSKEYKLRCVIIINDPQLIQINWSVLIELLIVFMQK